jgi:hypothetical protein
LKCFVYVRICLYFALINPVFLPLERLSYEKRRLRLRNIRFFNFNDGKLLQYNSPILNCIAITFLMQKKDEKSDATTKTSNGIYKDSNGI